MSKSYKPNLPFNVPALHLKRSLQKINGVNTEVFTEADKPFYCSAKSYGGTETTVNGIIVIKDTWNIETFYNPAFGKGDKIRFLDDNTEYEILASPENINRACQYMKFKAERIGG